MVFRYLCINVSSLNLYLSDHACRVRYTFTNLSSICLYIYIYMCVCVCVCVCIEEFKSIYRNLTSSIEEMEPETEREGVPSRPFARRRIIRHVVGEGM